MLEFLNLLVVVVPIALVAAVSPTTFTIMMVILSLSENPKTSSIGFWTGSFLIILFAAVLGFFATEGISFITNTDINILPGWINAILGVILIYFGVRSLFKRDRKSNEETMEDRLKNKYASFGFFSSALLAMGLFALNLITTILVFFASSQIAASTAIWMGKIVSLILLVLITLLLVEIPLLICFLFPQKADTILSKLNGWIQKRSHYLTSGLTIIVGLYILLN